jgi:phytanoyl-CoA hydroxylase
MSVTGEQLDVYKRDGYVLFPGALTDEDLAPLIGDHEAIVDEIAQDLRGQGKISHLCEGEPFDRRLARLADQCDQVRGCPDIGNTRRRGTYEFLRNERLVDLIEAFIGPEITCNPVSHVRPKMPATDVIFHQDAVFTTQEAKDILQITVWTPLVDATQENGCLQVQPGVHQQEIVYWTYNQDLPETERVLLPMRKGDVLIMHKLTPHGSGPNNTDAVRWSMDLRYQKTGEPSPRPEWPNLIVRSRRDPTTETCYEDWRERWAAALNETPEHHRYPRPNEPQPFAGEMYLT